MDAVTLAVVVKFLTDVVLKGAVKLKLNLSNFLVHVVVAVMALVAVLGYDWIYSLPIALIATAVMVLKVVFGAVGLNEVVDGLVGQPAAPAPPAPPVVNQ